MAPAIFKQTGEKEEAESPPAGNREAGVVEAKNAGREPSVRQAVTARSSGSSSVSFLAPGTTIRGDVSLNGELQLEGKVEGSVKTQGKVVIGAGGSVAGDVEAEEIVVAGRVEGTLLAKKALRLKRDCHVSADLQSPALEIEEGATLEGKVDMSGGAGGK